jgi:hypothetical protein
MTILTQAELTKIVSYDPNTGAFTWLSHRGNGVRAGAIAGCITGRGYVQLNIMRRSEWAHRLAFLYMTGKFPEAEVDHINGDKGDNAFSNLRCADRFLNAQNKRTSQGSSGVLGVRRRGNRFEASIKASKVSTYLGRFATPEEAHSAYLAAKRRLHEGCTI